MKNITKNLGETAKSTKTTSTRWEKRDCMCFPVFLLMTFNLLLHNLFGQCHTIKPMGFI